jgi:hypothetical protein
MDWRRGGWAACALALATVGCGRYVTPNVSHNVTPNVLSYLSHSVMHLDILGLNYRYAHTSELGYYLVRLEVVCPVLDD